MANEPGEPASPTTAEAQLESVAQTSKPLPPFQRRLKKIVYNAIAEGVNSLFFILLLAGGRWLVERMFGQTKLFDFLPVRYVFDAGDLAVMARFIWSTIRSDDSRH